MKKYILIVLSKSEHDYQQPIKTWRCDSIEQVRQIKECVQTCLNISGFTQQSSYIEKHSLNSVYTENVIFTNDNKNITLSVLYFSSKHISNILKEELNDGRA